MKLRARMAATTALVAVPLVVSLALVNNRLHRAEERQHTTLDLVTQMLSGERARCEADAANWRGPPHGPRDHGPPSFGPPPPDAPPMDGPPPPMPPRDFFDRDHRGPRESFAYDALLHAADSRAPALVNVRAPEREDAPVDFTGPRGEPMLLVKMPWSEGPCAFVLTHFEHHGPNLLPPLELWLGPVVAVMLGLFISLGSPLRRLRKLAEQARGAASRNSPLPTEPGDDEIAEVGRAFAEAHNQVLAEKQQQETREAALRNHLSNTTHDVMIPLTALQAHLAKLAEQGAKPELTGAIDEALYIAALVNNLAISARLEAGMRDLARDPVDLKAVLARAVSRHGMLAKQRGVALDQAAPSEAVIVEGDVTLLEQAVSNLVGNAVRYNQSGGHVAAVLERSGARFTLRILDDGPGVPEEQLAKIFERGFRTDAARGRAPSGQGLGLSIAREVVTRHGFELAVAKSEYGGLAVTIIGVCR